ncbi:MAG: 1,4-alpha-glucan branching protein GlgB [Rubrivivax sp.]
MLSDADLQALLQARHPDPFAVLGMHTDADGELWVRALLPGAAEVALQDTRGGRRVAGLLERAGTGLFEARLPRRRRHFDYRLRVSWRGAGGAAQPWQVLADAYRYGPLIAHEDLQALAEGRHLRPFEVLGAHPLTLGEGPYAIDGVRFALWAPNARRASVVGDFNAWDGRRHPMRHRGASGVWELFVPHAQPGDRYKFELLGPDGALLPARSDPYARQAELRPHTASLVAPALPPPRALPLARAAANTRRAPMAIYEVHAGSWRRRADGSFLSWDELAQALPAYAADLGFTHVELLPVSEHPFDGSWGYQTLGLYAPSARFGPPEGLPRFVQACHAQGLGVLADWVPAHFPADAHGLAQFDGTALYEYADPREGFHRDWNTLIYNFGRHEVANFLLGSALYWVERLGVDGLRVDAVASMLYRDYSREAGQWIPNAHGGRENLEAIALLRRMNEIIGAHGPGAVTVAEESTAFPGVSAPTWAGGLGFHFKWNMGWMNDTLRYMREDPVHRRWHHERMTFGLVYAFSENFVLPLSHDEVVHGKGSILGRMPGDDWQRFANLRAYYGFMWGHPGKKLLFMGQEFAQPGEWNHDTELPWALLQQGPHLGVQRLVRDLNRLLREQPALHRLDAEPQGFEWIDPHDALHSVFSWVRRDDAGGQVLVVSNMTPVPRTLWRLGVPEGPAAWREALNTDSHHYGGSNLGNGAAALAVQDVPAHGRARSIVLTLPPLSTLFLLPHHP